LLCVDGRIRQCYPVIWAWTADYFENIHFQSSSPITRCAKHQNRHLEKGIHPCRNWDAISYTSKQWYSQLREMQRRVRKQYNIWKIEQLASQNASSGIWNTSRQRLLSYPLFFILPTSDCLHIWWSV
jgi:hypothetical protein